MASKGKKIVRNKQWWHLEYSVANSRAAAILGEGHDNVYMGHIHSGSHLQLKQ